MTRRRWWHKWGCVLLAAMGANFAGELLGIGFNLPPLWVGRLQGSFSVGALALVFAAFDSEITVEKGGLDG